MIDVTRTPVAPAAVASGKLRDPEVLRTLHGDFLEKCYLCESRVTLGGFEIDHRVPKGEDPSRERDWTNLFPICAGCNKRRKKTTPPGGLLEPASGDGCIASRIEQRIIDRYPYPTRPGFRAVNIGDQAAANTAAELDHIHNEPSAIKAEDLRKAIMEHQRRVFLHCSKYLGGTLSEADRRELREYLKELFSRRAPFTALTRAELAVLGPAITELFD